MALSLRIDNDELEPEAINICLRRLSLRAVVCDGAACSELSPNLATEPVIPGSHQVKGSVARTADALIPAGWVSVSYIFTDPVTQKKYVLPATATTTGKLALSPAFVFGNDARLRRDANFNAPGYEGWALDALQFSTNESLGVPTLFGAMLKQRFAECRAKAKEKRINSARAERDPVALNASLDDASELASVFAGNAKLFEVEREKASAELLQLSTLNVEPVSLYAVAERRSQLKVQKEDLAKEIARSKNLQLYYEKFVVQNRGTAAKLDRMVRERSSDPSHL